MSLALNAQTFTNYTTDDGLINNAVNCVAVDNMDNVWFGTQGGLSYFDGTTWVNYNQDSHPDLINNAIQAVAVDSDNGLWLGTDFGANHYDGSNWATYTDDDGLADNRIRYINQDAQGRVWFANNDGITIKDGDNWTSYVMSDGIPFGGCNFVTFDAEGIAYLGTPLAGVLVFDGTTFTPINEDSGLLSNQVRSIAIDEDGNKWIATDDGISFFNANDEFVTHHESIFELPPPHELNPVEDIQIDSKGRVWVGVYIDYLVDVGGVSLYPPHTQEWVDYDVSDGLVGPVVRRLDITSEDIVWVVTSTGITKIGDLPTNTFDLAINQDIRVFPNPMSDELNVTVPADLLQKEFQVFDNLGRVIQRGDVNATQFQINCSGLQKGYYYLVIDGVYARKIVK